MEPTKELIDALYADRVRRARAMPLEEKLLAGIELFGRSCKIMASGIRADFPQASEEEVQRILGERLRLARRLEQIRDR